MRLCVNVSMEWRTKLIEGEGNTSTWSAGQLGAPGYLELCQWLTGESIVRVRIQGQLAFNIRNTDPSTNLVDPSILSAMGCFFGVWAKADGGSATPPLGVPVLGSLNDSFVFYNSMTQTILTSFQESTTIQDNTAVYTFPYGDGDAKSRRGPATADTFAWLVFGFVSAGFNPTVNTSTGIASFYNYSLNVSCLFDHVA